MSPREAAAAATARRVCTIDGCERKHLAHGYCRTHYGRHVEGKAPTATAHMEDVEWLAATGETWERAAQRLGIKPDSLDRLLRRAGRHDLIDHWRKVAAP